MASSRAKSHFLRLCLAGFVVKKRLLVLLARADTTPAVLVGVCSGEKLSPERSCAVTAKFFVQPADTHRGFSLFSPRCTSSEGQDKAGLEQELTHGTRCIVR